MTTPSTLLACALTALALPATAAEPKVDPELLEFLGSFGDEAEFMEFLEQLPVEKPPEKKPAEAAKPVDPKQVKKP